MNRILLCGAQRLFWNAFKYAWNDIFLCVFLSSLFSVSVLLFGCHFQAINDAVMEQSRFRNVRLAWAVDSIIIIKCRRIPYCYRVESARCLMTHDLCSCCFASEIQKQREKKCVLLCGYILNPNLSSQPESI